MPVVHHQLAAAPRLETERLVLRGYRADDLAQSLALWCEPKVYQFIAGKPSTEEDCWRGILRHIGQWQVVGFGFWVVEEKSSGQFVGELGFLDCRRAIVPSMNDTPEMGWALRTAFHGKGYATEAISRIAAWGDANLSQEKFACIIAPENTASLRLAQKLGFHEVARTTYKGEPTLLLHRLKQGRV